MDKSESAPDTRSLPARRTRRIGIHLGIAGGLAKAVERAHEIGANTLQIFSSSPRMWRPSSPDLKRYAEMRELCSRYDCRPLVIHSSYLINLSSQSETVREKSIVAFRGEVERALGLDAQFLVLHAGSSKDLARTEALALAAESMKASLNGVRWAGSSLKILIENTAGSERSLGGSLENVAELGNRLRSVAPIAVCLDTCHLHAAGYRIATAQHYEATVLNIEQTIGLEAVRVWHMNDAKAALGSHLDRHEHIGQGTIGYSAFRMLVRDPRFAHAAFIAETPVDEPGDDERNLATLLSLAQA